METIIPVTMPDGTIRSYVFPTAPTVEQMDEAMDHLGGKPKRDPNS